MLDFVHLAKRTSKLLAMKRFYFYALLFLFPLLPQAQITFDGVITEGDWGAPLSEADLTYATTPGPGFGAGHEINSVHIVQDATNFYFALSGNVQASNRILLFIDSKSGGYNSGDFGRTSAPAGINNFNSGTTFDAGFTADYCLVIGTDGSGTYFFDLFELDGTAVGGGGSNIFLGTEATAGLGASPLNSDKTRGFEVTIPYTDLGYAAGSIRVMAMYSSDGGYLSNQFLSPAGAAEGDYTGNAVTFGAASPDFVTFNSTFPVELFDFSGTFQSNGVALTWTAAEELFSHYEVERLSEDGAFEQIDRVAAEGEFGQPTSYQYLDHNAPLGQTLTYRLAMVDMDGSINYSNQIEVSSAEGAISISPNPTYGQLTVALPGTPRNPGTIRVLNMQGQTVYSQSLAEGQSVWNLDLSDLASGAYQAVIQWDNQRTVKRFSLY